MGVQSFKMLPQKVLTKTDVAKIYNISLEEYICMWNRNIRSSTMTDLSKYVDMK